MFRDLETGATYVQTQLLQDDPPNLPEFYSEEGSDQSGLSGGDLTMTLLQEDSLDTVEFTGTTINLQDLQ